jgi:hypothetical protein
LEINISSTARGCGSRYVDGIADAARWTVGYILGEDRRGCREVSNCKVYSIRIIPRARAPKHLRIYIFDRVCDRMIFETGWNRDDMKIMGSSIVYIACTPELLIKQD